MYAIRSYYELNTTVRAYDRLDIFGEYPSGTKVTETPEILFARLDIKEVLEKAEALKPAAAPDTKESSSEIAALEDTAIDLDAKPEITYDDFAKLQFQVGEIMECKAVERNNFV